MVHQVTSESDYNTQISSSKLTVVDFFATWCGPCVAVAPKVDQLSSMYPGVNFIKVDVDKLKSVAQNAQVRAMPTFQFYKNGAKACADVVGADINAVESNVKKYGDLFSAFSGGGKTLGGSDAVVHNPWADERKKDMEKRKQKESSSNSNQIDTSVYDNINDDMLLKETLKLKKKKEQKKKELGLDEELQKKEEEDEDKGCRITITVDDPNYKKEEVLNLVKKQANEDFLQQLLSMEFSENRALKALLKTKSVSVDTAIDWIMEHQDDEDIDEEIIIKVETAEEKQKRMEEARMKAKLLQQKVREKLRKAEKESEREREKKRRIIGKETNESMDKFKEAQRMREIAEQKKEKQRLKDEKKKMKKLLLADKLKRKIERYQREGNNEELRKAEEKLKELTGSSIPSSSSPSSSSSTTTKEASDNSNVSTNKSDKKSDENECIVQVRLLDGTAQKCKFKLDDTIKTVHDHIAMLFQQNSKFALMTNFPRKTYSSPSDYSTTLRQVFNNQKRGQLICTHNA